MGNSIKVPPIKINKYNCHIDIPQYEISLKSITGIYGISGSGKSTYAASLADSLPNSYLITQRDTVFESLSVRQNIELVCANFGVDTRSESFNNKLTLNSRLLGINEKLELLANGLSGGERKRINVLRGLLINPQLLILDEPFVGVGRQIERVLTSLLRERKRNEAPSLVISHNIPLLWSIADRIKLLENGCFVNCVSPSEHHQNLKTVPNSFIESLSVTNVFSIEQFRRIFCVEKLKDDIFNFSNISFWEGSVSLHEGDYENSSSEAYFCLGSIISDHLVLIQELYIKGQRYFRMEFEFGKDSCELIAKTSGRTTKSLSANYFFILESAYAYEE